MTIKGMCLLERLFAEVGFKVIHDGQRNPGQFEFPADEIRFFTRKYRLFMDDEPLNTWAVFKYDRRSNLADFEVYSRDPDIVRKSKSSERQEMSLNTQDAKEVLNGKH